MPAVMPAAISQKVIDAVYSLSSRKAPRPLSHEPSSPSLIPPLRRPRLDPGQAAIGFREEAAPPVVLTGRRATHDKTTFGRLLSDLLNRPNQIRRETDLRERIGTNRRKAGHAVRFVRSGSQREVSTREPYSKRRPAKGQTAVACPPFQATGTHRPSSPRQAVPVIPFASAPSTYWV